MVKKIYLHEAYEDHLDTLGVLANDIALLVLQDKLTIGQYVNPICLPTEHIVGKVAYFVRYY